MGGPIILYGTAIQEAISKRDLVRMKELAKVGEKERRPTPEVQKALESLKLEIAKLEKRRF